MSNTNNPLEYMPAMDPEEFKSLFFDMMAGFSGKGKSRGCSFGSAIDGPWAKDDGEEETLFIFAGGDDVSASALYSLETREIKGKTVKAQVPLTTPDGSLTEFIYGTFDGLSVFIKPSGEYNTDVDNPKKALRLRLTGRNGEPIVLQLGLGTVGADAIIRGLQMLANYGELTYGVKLTIQAVRGEEKPKVVLTKLFADRGSGRIEYLNTKDTAYDLIRLSESLSVAEKTGVRTTEHITRIENILNVMNGSKDDF